MTPQGPTSRLLISGTLTLDTIERHGHISRDVPGGSALYAAAGASVLMPVQVLGTVGDDFPFDDLTPLWTRGIDHSAIGVVDGPTFYWHARYSADGDIRTTVKRNPGVDFGRMPSLAKANIPDCALLLGSTDPRVQAHVRDAIPDPHIVGLDSMAHWWRERADSLRLLLSRVQVLFVDESELALATNGAEFGEGIAQLMALGPEVVVVKLGSRGALMKRRGGTLIRIDAVKLSVAADPTGAGDAFAGAFVAALARFPEREDEHALCFATAAASFAVEGIGTSNLQQVERSDVEARMDTLTVSSVE